MPPHWIECPHCHVEFVEGSGHEGGSLYVPEEFCDENCHDNAMEKRAERAHDRGF